MGREEIYFYLSSEGPDHENTIVFLVEVGHAALQGLPLLIAEVGSF